MWDAEKSTELLALQGHTGYVNSVCFSPDGRRILTGSGAFYGLGRLVSGEAKVWDAEKGTELLALKGHTQPVSSVCFSPDGQRAFAWDATGQVLAWSVKDGKPVAADDPPDRPAPGSATSPDGRLVAKPEGNVITIVDLLQPSVEATPWPLPDAAQRTAYHGEQAALAENERQWFAVAFHVGRLLLDEPDNADLKERREEALRKHAAP